MCRGGGGGGYQTYMEMAKILHVHFFRQGAYARNWAACNEKKRVFLNTLALLLLQMPSVVAQRGLVYKCTSCRQMGPKAQMSAHVVEAYLPQEVPFWCGICAKRFYRQDHLADHHKRRHPVEEEDFLGMEELRTRDATQ